MNSQTVLSEDDSEQDDSRPLREMQSLLGHPCQDCSQSPSAREVLFSIAMGFKNAPRCRSCLARRLDRNPDELQTQLIEYMHRRDCYLKAWKQALVLDQADGITPESGVRKETVQSNPVVAGSHWDAGGLGCGELVMELRMRLNNLPAGSVLQVTATDPAAPEDLPSWCRMAGHTLMSMEHPNYFIRRKGAPDGR